MNERGAHAEIARRYARRDGRRRERRPFSMAALRIAEINRLYLDQYGPGLPDDDAGRDNAMVAVHHLAKLGDNPAGRIRSWLRVWAPWMPPEEAQALTCAALLRPLRWKADTLAARLGVTAERRTRLKIRTIGAIDQTKEERAELQRQRRRLAAQARRRAKGARSRDEYLRQRREHARQAAQREPPADEANRCVPHIS